MQRQRNLLRRRREDQEVSRVVSLGSGQHAYSEPAAAPMLRSGRGLGGDGSPRSVRPSVDDGAPARFVAVACCRWLGVGKSRDRKYYRCMLPDAPLSGQR